MHHIEQLDRAARRFRSDEDVIAVVGSAGRAQRATGSPGRLIWLIRMADGLMAEMWTYQQHQSSR